jgi:hypothetical protein
VDRGLISEKQRGLSAKSAKLDRRLISEKQRGFFAKWRGILTGIYFSTDKAVDRVHASVDWPGAQQREECMGSSARASPGLGWHRCSVRGLPRSGERGKEAGRGAVKLGGGARLL